MATPTALSPGGFFPPTQTILSPPASSLASTSAYTSLPHPRSQPLKPGSSKESAFIRFVDTSILKIQRRYAIRGGEGARDVGAIDVMDEVEKRKGEEAGYKSFSEVVKDVERVVDLIWVSGTPSLQIPYLLHLASLITTYLPSFPASAKPTFRILTKLDIAFSSLLQGRHVDTGEPLPGFDTGKKVSGTEKVRLKSLVDRTRMVVMDVIGGGGGDLDEEDGGDGIDGEETDFDVETDTDADEKMDLDTDGEGANFGRNGGGDYGVEDLEMEMGVVRVYDRTVVELGDTIGGSPIGIITDD